ncbi:hypothetical protein VTK26DRAFT_9278 [Humicola hyalothermophila]
METLRNLETSEVRKSSSSDCCPLSAPCLANQMLTVLQNRRGRVPLHLSGVEGRKASIPLCCAERRAPRSFLSNRRRLLEKHNLDYILIRNFCVSQSIQACHLSETVHKNLTVAYPYDVTPQ